MTCKKTTEQLIDWLEGELPEDAAEAVDRHVADCPDCAGEVQQIREALAAVSHPAEDPGDAFFASFYPRLRQRLEIEAIPWTQRIWNWFWSPGVWVRSAAAAAVVIFAVMATLVATDQMPNPNAKPTLIAKKGVAVVDRRKVDLFAVSNVDPALRQAVEDLENEELDTFRVEIAKLLIEPFTGKIAVSLPGVSPDHPAVNPTSTADLDENEIVQVAELLSRDMDSWTR
jgi:Putative zinc-finger